MLIYVCYLSVVLYHRRCVGYLLFSSAVLRAKGAESLVFDSGLIVTLLLFDS